MTAPTTTTTTAPADVDGAGTEPADDELAALPAEKLAHMLRQKRKSEADVRGRLRETEAERDALTSSDTHSRLRDLEAERDRLTASVTGYHSRALNGYATSQGLASTALEDLATAVPLESVVSEAGVFDEALAAEALAAVRAARPHWFTNSSGVSGADFTGATGGGLTPAVPTYTWADALR